MACPLINALARGSTTGGSRAAPRDPDVSSSLPYARDVQDPWEGVDAAGFVVTGARADRIPSAFAAAVDEAADQLYRVAWIRSVHLYGSIATGLAVPGRSDIDLLAVGRLPTSSRAAEVFSFADSRGDRFEEPPPDADEALRTLARWLDAAYDEP